MHQTYTSSFSPGAVLLRYLRRHWSVPTIIRLFLVFLMAATFVLGCWAGITAPLVHAATLAQTQPSTAHTSPAPLPYAPYSPSLLHVPNHLGAPSKATSLGNHELSVGDQPYYTYMRWQVNDHLNLAVNVASGNLVVHTSDLHIQGTGLDLAIERFYNPIATTGQHSVLSQHWNLSVAPDVYLQFNSDGSVTYYSPTGTPYTFTPKSGGGFNDPPGLNATLNKQANSSDGLYHIDFHKTREAYEFDSSGRMIDDEDKNGNHIAYTYTNGQMTSITDTQGRSISFSYDSSGRLTTITDPTGRTVRYSYDSNGNLASSTDARGQTTTYSYVDDDDLSQITDPAGHTFQFIYSSSSQFDEVTGLTDATGATTNFSYTVNSDNSNTTVVTDSRGNKTTYQADLTMRVTKVTDALGHNQSTTYTSNNDVTSLQDSLTNTATFQFDANNNITSAADATGAKDTFSYQDSSHPFSVTGSTDAQGTILGYTYDSPGNLTDVKDLTNGNNFTKAHYDYNSNGTLKDMRDGNGNQTNYSYDSMGNLIKVTPPSPLGQTTIQRDSLSRAISVTDGKGQTTTFTYDALDRIIKVTYADGSNITYVRDIAGNVTSVTDNTGITTFTYDAANRLLSKTLPGGTTLTMHYDSVGNLTSFTDAGGTVNYNYNAVNLVKTLTEPGGAQTTFGYDANNRRTATNYPNGIVLSISYDKAGHEIGISAKNQSGTTLSSYSYDYQGTHLRKVMKDNVLGQETDYSYNSVNRLLQAIVENSSGSQIASYQYSYDGAGNRTSQTINGAKTTFSYNAANQLTSTSQGVSYSYDANGNLTGIAAPSGNTTLTYNAKDQTTAINGVPMTYTGPDQNQRVQQGNTSYVNAPFGISSLSDGSGTTYFTRDNSGNLVAERTPAGTFYYLFDGLGSVVGLTDGSGNLVGNERYQYDPFGNLIAPGSSSVLQANIWRFAGGQFDSNSNLTKFGVRYYDPSVGRWTQQDPMAGSLFDPRSPNRYVYAKCDPVNVVDPGGKAPAGNCIFQIIVGSLTISYSTEGIAGALLGVAGVAAAAAALPLLGAALLGLAASFLVALVVSYSAYEIATAIGSILQSCS